MLILTKNLAEVIYLSNKNIADSISNDVEQDKLTSELLICSVTSEDFS